MRLPTAAYPKAYANSLQALGRVTRIAPLESSAGQKISKGDSLRLGRYVTGSVRLETIWTGNADVTVGPREWRPWLVTF
jgi:hypothetical protein